MLRRGYISEGWLGELYAGEDAQGRTVRFVSLSEYSEQQRQWILDRIRLMNTSSIQGAIPQLGIRVIQGEPCWVAAWRDAVQLSAVLESKHIPNTVIMATAFGILQSLYSAEKKGIYHGALHPNGIWLGVDGSVWIDGYGQSIVDKHSTAEDIYAVGCMLIEMFLGTNPFPVEDGKHVECMREISIELQAMGLPNKLPKQVLTLLHPDPSKRPRIELLIQKWKLTRAKSIVSSWVRSQFPALQDAYRPEDRIPTATRIAPLPFPDFDDEVEVEELDPIPVLDSDDTVLTPRGEMVELENDGDGEVETTQVLLVETAELTGDDPTEETQAIQFLEDFEADFFDSEPTSKLVVDGLLTVDDDDIEVESVELREEMEVPSRRTFTGVLWFCAVLMMTGGGMYIIIPDVPAYPERQSLLASTAPVAKEELNPIASVEPSPSVQSEVPTTIEPSSPKVQQLDSLSIQSSGTPSVQEPSEQKNGSAKVSPEPKDKPVQSADVKRSKKVEKKVERKVAKTASSASKSKTVRAKSPQKPLQKTAPKKTTKASSVVSKPANQEASEKKEEPKSVEVVEKPARPSGMVSKSGEVQKVRLEQKGRDVPLGSVTPGVYSVYAKFDGFSEFKVATLTVKDGQKYNIHCDASFAACSIK